MKAKKAEEPSQKQKQKQISQELPTNNNNMYENQFQNNSYSQFQFEPNNQQKSKQQLNKKSQIQPKNQLKLSQQLSQQQKQLLSKLSTKQLLQQKNKLIQQLQKINTNLSELIDQREKSILELESLKKQTSQNKVTYKQMTQQCRDYQFMLSGDYSVKLSQQIQYQKTYLRQLRKQLSQLNKEMKQPIQAIIKQNQQKRKEHYDLQLFVMQQKTLLQQKKLKLQQIQRQSDIKKDKTNKLNYRQKQLKKLIEMYFDEDYETIMTRNPKNAEENYQKLKSKKQKLNKVLISQQSNCLKNYNRKLAQTREIDRFLLEVQEAINQCSLKIIQTKHQKQKQNQKHKNSRFLLSRKNKQTRQTLSSDHYNYENNHKLNSNKKLFSLPKFVQKRVVSRYPDNNPYNRTRIYTELENSNYFKNSNTNKEQQISHDRIKTDSGYKNFSQYQLNKNNNQSQLQAQKLQILKSLLNQELVQKHKRIKDKKLSFIAQRNNPTLNSMKMNTQIYQQQQQQFGSEECDHYRQLCNQLGKQKLLIEQDQDIRELIYEGIGGSGKR